MSKKPDVSSILVGDDDAPAAKSAAEPVRRQSAGERAAELREQRSRGMRARTLGGFTQRLVVHGTVPGYQLATLNDDGSRIADALAHGFEFVQYDELESFNGDIVAFNSDPGSKVRFNVGTAKNGEVMYAYVMKIPLDIWEEDQQFKNQQAMAPIEQMKRGMVPHMTQEEVNDMQRGHDRPPITMDIKTSLSRQGVTNGS